MIVAKIGAGPIGLAAAHLVEQNISFKIFEAAVEVGANIKSWGHVRLFSPWKFNIDTASKRLLEKTHWLAPDEKTLHTGKEFLEKYLRPLSSLPTISPFIHLNTKVKAITRKGLDKMKTSDRENKSFELRLSRNGQIKLEYADVVFDTSGTWNQPNPIGSGGLFAEGKLELSSKIHQGIPDILDTNREEYKGQNVMVVGTQPAIRFWT